MGKHRTEFTTQEVLNLSQDKSVTPEILQVGCLIWTGSSWVKVGGGTPTVYNVTMTNANTEYSLQLPETCYAFEIKCRGDYDIKLSFSSGQSGTTYFTIPAGEVYWIINVALANKTIYFQCPTAGQVAEIITYS